MDKNCLTYMKERGFFQQCTNEENLNKMFQEKQVTFYCGFDATAKSLHVGSMLIIMAMAHLQRMGHKPIALVGGGTTMIGDPSGKTESRKMLTVEQIDEQAQMIKKQLEQFVVLDGEKGVLVNNADWLRNINYLDFLRDIGRHFSVNRMLSFETYKERLKYGLSFLEFNYCLMQSYDFLELYRRHNCQLQVGGDDQWANMVSGVDLIRRVERTTDVECLTFPLMLTSDGKKMGKTEKGAVFLDANLFSPYDFYQFWVNTTDADTIKYMKIYTFLPLDEIKKYEKLEGHELVEAKQLLAYEVTKIVHGETEAKKARDGALAAFGGGDNVDLIPFTEVGTDRLTEGISVLDVFVESGLCASKGEVRRLIKQGGVRINGDRVENELLTVNNDHNGEDGIILRVGKKKVHRLKIV